MRYDYVFYSARNVNDLNSGPEDWTTWSRQRKSKTKYLAFLRQMRVTPYGSNYGTYMGMIAYNYGFSDRIGKLDYLYERRYETSAIPVRSSRYGYDQEWFHSFGLHYPNPNPWTIAAFIL